MNLDKIVISGVVATVAFVAAVGCGSDTKAAASPGAATTSTAASDEQQVLDLIEEDAAALVALDIDKIGRCRARSTGTRCGRWGTTWSRR